MFQGKVRVRVCGLLISEDKVLLLNHSGIGQKGALWSPPGGGIEFGEGAKETLIREFMEETNLEITVGEYLFLNEHIDEKHHAIELFFRVTYRSGHLSLGTDPEMDEQILTDVKFFSLVEIRKEPIGTVHSIFEKVDSLDDLFNLRGYFHSVQL